MNVHYGQSLTWFNFQCAIIGLMLCTSSLKAIIETCIATHEQESFQHGSPKRASMCVYIEFSLEVSYSTFEEFQFSNLLATISHFNPTQFSIISQN